MAFIRHPVNPIAAFSVWVLYNPSVNQHLFFIADVVLKVKNKKQRTKASLQPPFPIGPSIQTCSCKQWPDLWLKIIETQWHGLWGTLRFPHPKVHVVRQSPGFAGQKLPLKGPELVPAEARWQTASRLPPPLSIRLPISIKEAQRTHPPEAWAHYGPSDGASGWPRPFLVDGLVCGFVGLFIAIFVLFSCKRL